MQDVTDNMITIQIAVLVSVGLRSLQKVASEHGR